MNDFNVLKQQQKNRSTGLAESLFELFQDVTKTPKELFGETQ